MSAPVTGPFAQIEGAELVETGATPVARVLEGRSPMRIAFARLRRDKVAVACAVVLVILVLGALSAPLITSAMHIYADAADPNAPNASTVLGLDGFPLRGPPDFGFDIHHPLGVAPQTGVDNFAYLLYGTRTSLFIAVLATVLATALGTVVGLVSGYARGWVDRALVFVTDLFLSFPLILGALTLAPIITSHYATDQTGLARAQLLALITVLTVLGWMGVARLIRGQVLSLREREFIEAARVIGVPTWQILFKELLPNLIAQLVVAVSLAVPAFVATEAGLSYLGIGVTNVPDLGRVINDAVPFYQSYPLYLWAPVVTITVLVLALNLLGDSVRDAFDPKTRR